MLFLDQAGESGRTVGRHHHHKSRDRTEGDPALRTAPTAGDTVAADLLPVIVDAFFRRLD